jgi:hypothetical protein
MMTPPNSADAVSFLERFYPDEHWVISSLSSEGVFMTRTYNKESKQEALEFINKHNDKTNLYFSVNQPNRSVVNKMSREDVEYVYYLHVDIDPDIDINKIQRDNPSLTDNDLRPFVEEHILKEREKIYDKITIKRPQSIPTPTFIIDSGGGYQLFWRLNVPVHVHGDKQKTREVEEYNKQLAIMFDGDKCFDVSRVMRLPGTINIPNKSKIAKGRTKAQAKLVLHNPDAVYSLDQFQKAPPSQMGMEEGFGSTSFIDIDLDNLPPVKDLDDLDKLGLPETLKRLIVQGAVHDQPKKGDNSRSAWLFDCVCQLVRRNIPDAAIISIITNPTFEISRSVLEKKQNCFKYAIRQVENAHIHSVHPKLHELCQKYMVVMHPSSCIIAETYDEVLKRPRIDTMDFNSFKMIYSNVSIPMGTDAKGRPVEKKLGHAWLEFSKRRTVDRIVFHPGQVTGNVYNLWRGFAYEAKEGGDCSLYLSHLEHIICNGNQQHFNYLLKWMARTVQKPDILGKVAFVMKGKPGTGKGTTASQFGQLFGRHFLHVLQSEHLVGKYNAHLRDALVVFADEQIMTDKKSSNVLQGLITEPTFTVEAKFGAIEPVKNFMHIIMSTNENHVVQVNEDDRRFFIVNVNNKYSTAKDPEAARYFHTINQQLNDNNGAGYSALLHHLLNINLHGFDVEDMPHTDARAEQILLGLNSLEEWWYSCLGQGYIVSGPHVNLFPKTWPDNKEPTSMEKLWQCYGSYVGDKRSVQTLSVFARSLKSLLPDERRIVTAQGSGRKAEMMNAYRTELTTHNAKINMPSLKECRQAFNETKRQQFTWESPAQPRGRYAADDIL